MENIQFTARRWLEQPGLDDRGLGRQAIALVVEDGLKIATVLPGNCHTHRKEDFTKGRICLYSLQCAHMQWLFKIGSQGGDRVVALCKSIQQNSADLANLCAAGAGDTPQALDLAKRVATDLGQLKEAIQTALVDKVVEDFMDVVSPLKVTLSYNHFWH